MPKWAICYVRGVEALNYRLGRIVMYLLFAIMGILLWAAVVVVTVISVLCHAAVAMVERRVLRLYAPEQLRP